MTQLVSSRSSTNCSSGFYKLYFDIDSILRLHYEGPESTTVFWPDPGLLPWEARRNQYMYNRSATLDSDGRFNSSDGFGFLSADFGVGPQRMMRIDYDGDMRLYSLIEHQGRTKWEIQWQAVSHSCRIHGICGANSLCIYSSGRRRCTCLHGYKMVNSKDWSSGCEPDFEVCKPDDEAFVELRHVEFYGFDMRYHNNYTLDACKKDCLQDCNCKGFQFGYNDDHGVGTYYCYIKTSLYNGYQMGFYNSMYIKLPKSLVSSFVPKAIEKSSLRCTGGKVTQIIRSYEKKQESKILKFVLVLGCVIGFIEIIVILYFWYKSSKRSVTTSEQVYFPAATAFRKFTYSELKKASRNFSEEIGRGSESVVYKGRLPDNRIAAIKKLKNTNHHNERRISSGDRHNRETKSHESDRNMGLLC
ncbi:unnamed protein product [Lactuca saligna]|uniref:Apple domain-containing protein n=1 Tax=Lactuca saligna TaxID=75948 RepID=A0AA35ZFR0_LACSI|nr:unnamed protein product [Lactuca saligna]